MIRFSVEDPQAEAMLLSVVNILVDLFPGRLFQKRLAVCGEGLHDLGIRKKAMEIVEVQGGDGLRKQASGGQGGDGVGHGAILFPGGWLRYNGWSETLA
jgi:hypothetical protein